MESLLNPSSLSEILSQITFLYISTALNLAMRSLLIIGTIAVAKYVNKTTRWCLLAGSILFAASGVLTSSIPAIVMTRTMNPAQYGYLTMAIGFISNLSLLIFGIGFLLLCRKHARFLSHRQ